MWKLYLLVICLLLNYENGISKENDDNLLQIIKNVFSQMTEKLTTGQIDISTFEIINNHADNNVALENLVLYNVSIQNWLSDIVFNYINAFYSSNNPESRNAEPEKVIIVNYTLPYLLFTAEYSLNNIDTVQIVNCTMSNVAVGLFLHIVQSDGVYYVDNFQMAPPNISSVIFSNSNEYNTQDISIWKLVIWVITNEIIDYYLKDFKLTENNYNEIINSNSNTIPYISITL